MKLAWHHQLVVSLVIAMSSTVKADDPSVVAVSTTLGGPSTFVIAPGDSPDREYVVSSSVTIQNTLLPALLTGSKPVKLDLVPGSNVIKRVNPFAIGEKPAVVFDGDYIVSRLATQRKTNGTDEHLEVFLMRIGEKEEKAYNVYDLHLQQILIASFRSADKSGRKPLPVKVQLDGDEIVTITLGEKMPKQSKKKVTPPMGR